MSDVLPSVIVAAIVLLLAIVILAKTVRIVQQAQMGIVERLGRYHRTLTPGLAVVLPFVDRIVAMIDMREQVQPFAPQPVITSDNVTVSIDTVVYFQVTDPRALTYEIHDPIAAIEQLAITTLRNVIGSLDLEATLTSRDHINAQLRVTLDEATTKWGIRVSRVELKSIEPPKTVAQAMELQMKAEREKRAAILTAEGFKQSQILTAEGAKQSAILNAQGAREAIILNADGDRQARALRAQGEATAVELVTKSVQQWNLDERTLAWTYLQQLPLMANGQASKMWVVPAELTDAMRLAAAGFAQGRQDTP
ncbi:MAG: SPFH domain-containing protein [Candidatus Nanopelagicales bacterium]|nr:SPFH domain-containing protein [Candidatus Nanopelagicales bacterium]